MKPLDYFWDTASLGVGAFSQRFCTVFFALVRIIFAPLFRLRVFYGKTLRRVVEKKMASPGYILCGNHRSYLDPVFVMLAMRPLPMRFMAKEEFFKVGIIARLASWVGAFPVSRGTADMKAVKRMVAMLKRGELVGIFPEGTRVRDGAKRGEEVHEGIALIAHLAKADVIPFHLWGTEKISPPGSKRWHFPKIRLTFGEVLSLDAACYKAMSKEQRFTAFTQDCMDAVYALQMPEIACKDEHCKGEHCLDTNCGFETSTELALKKKQEES